MEIEGKKILIVGSSGFVGSHLKAHLLQECPGCELFELNRKGAQNPEGSEVSQNQHAFCGASPADFETALENSKPEIIFYCAGVLSSENWNGLFEGNVAHLYGFLCACLKKCKNARIVVAGSSSVYGNAQNLPISESQPLAPITQYGLSMQMRSQTISYFAHLGADIFEARLFNIIGPGISEKTSIGSFLRQIAGAKGRGEKCILKTGSLESRRDFLDVRDAASAFVAISKTNEKQNNVYNICSGKSIKMQDMVQKLIASSGIKVILQTEQARVQKADMPDNRGGNSILAGQTGWSQKYGIDESIKFALEQTIAGLPKQRN